MMKKKLWETVKSNLHPIIEAFTTGDDLLLDQKLVKYDVLGSIAHAKMLAKIGILSQKELEQVEKGLQEIAALDGKGKFILEPGDEDVHTKIENYLTEKYGEVGKKIHTGRSRNDQVITVVRLFTKDQLLAIWEEAITLADAFAVFAKKYEFVPMPGYTHMQKAMPSTVGMWASAMAESLLDDLHMLKAAYEIVNQSPLGSAAGYGVPLHLDREYTAKLMGFAKVQNNALYVQNGRGKIEAQVVSSVLAILATINKFATDVLIFTTAEFNFFTVSEILTSGSSIMPQKKNVDVAELLRVKVHVVLGYYTQLVSLSSNLPSGYNRDTQDTKLPLFNSLKIAKVSLEVSRLLLDNLAPNKDVLEKAMTPELFSAHHVFQLVKKGVAFREAYKKIKMAKFSSAKQNSQKMLHLSTHSGGTGNLGLQKLFKKITLEQKKLSTELEQWKGVIKTVKG